ncbi:MAG TPA: GxGYxYP domain-containing protein [Limnochordia bacterium]|nr:GxGYxYP domain-containing protein [Limnochordia bacterium]
MRRCAAVLMGILAVVQVVALSAVAAFSSAVAPATNLVANTGGEQGTADWHLAFNGRQATLDAVTDQSGRTWLHYQATLSEPIGNWVQYNLSTTADQAYNCTFEAKGSGVIYANAYDGLADIAAQPRALTDAPATFVVKFVSALDRNNQLQIRYHQPPVDVWFRNVRCAAVPSADLPALSTVQAPSPAGLEWPSERTFPGFERPRTLTTVVGTGLIRAERIALSSLQGLINRPLPRVYVLDNMDDVFWSKEALPGVTFETLDVGWGGEGETVAALLKKFPGVVRGLVIYDPAVPASIDVGTTLAGSDGGLLVSPELAARFEAAPYALPVLADLRAQHWTSALDAYLWAVKQLWTKTQHNLLFSLSPDIAGNLREYAVATNGFVFWLDPKSPDERALLERILAASPPNRPVLGWWTDEPAGVSIASQNARYTIASDFCDNLSVFGGFRLNASGLHQTTPAAPLKPSSGVYFAVTLSDGDNLQFMQHRLVQIWGAGTRGTIPVAYTVQPWAGEAAPTLLEYYYRTAKAGDLFVSGPSGPGYAYPELWPGDQLAPWLQLGAPLLQREDINIDEVWRYGRLDGPQLAAYARDLKPAALLLGNDGTGEIRTLDGTLAVANLGQGESVADAAAKLRPWASLAANHPVFLNLYVDAWKFDADWVQQLAQTLGPDFHLVRLDQLLGAARQAAPSG